MAGVAASDMHKIKRLFTIKTKFEAFLAIYAVAMGASARGVHYLHDYPGAPGVILFVTCCSATFIVGGVLLDAVALKQKYGE